MRSIVLITLSLFLGAFFVFVGTLKISQFVHREMHREIRRNFIQYAKVLPLNEKLIGFKVTPKVYRLAVGYLEILCGSLLIALPNDWRLKNASNLVLLASNLLTLYTHYKLNEKFERLAPWIVFSLMLICRLVVYWQVKRRFENQDKIKEREERRRLIETGEFDIDQLSLNEIDEDETIESLDDIDDDELEKILKLNRKLHKNKKRKQDKTSIDTDSNDASIEPDVNQLNEQLVDENKKSI